MRAPRYFEGLYQGSLHVHTFHAPYSMPTACATSSKLLRL